MSIDGYIVILVIAVGIILGTIGAFAAQAIVNARCDSNAHPRDDS